MSDRSMLEKASWVAGIVSAAVAIIVWLKPSPTEPAIAHPLQWVGPAKKVEEHKPTTSSVTQQEKAPAQLPASAKSWSCEGVATDLQPAFDTARKISYTDPRNSAFLSLARKALCFENYPMFEQAAGQISYTDVKNQAFLDAVDVALDARNFDMANKYADSISYTDLANKARARIVAKLSEQANPAVQGTLRDKAALAPDLQR